MTIMQRRLLLPLSLLLILVFNPANAEQETDSGIYISGSAGKNWIRSGIPEETTTILKAAAGWQITSNFGIELSYNDFGTFPGPTPAFTDFDLTGVSAAAIGRLPISTDIALFAKAGQVWWKADSTFFFFSRSTGNSTTETLEFSESDLFFGLGASYELTRTLEMDLEYNYYRFRFPDSPNFNNENAGIVVSLKWKM